MLTTDHNRSPRPIGNYCDIFGENYFSNAWNSRSVGQKPGNRTELLYNADDLFFTASTFKVPLLVGFYSQVELGNIGLNDRIEITEDSKLKKMAPGIKITFRDLTKLMIIVSDNTSADIIYNRVGKDYLHKIVF